MARTPMRTLLLLAVLVVLAPGCVMNPVTGHPEMTVLSSSKEQEIGREGAEDVKAAMGIVDDPALTAYVVEVGTRLAAQSPRRDVTYTFQIVDTPEPNAFALPGGWVYVSRGLLALLDSEDELAGVVGHEIGHVAARHAARRATSAAPLAVLTGVGAAVTGLVSPMLGGIVGGVGSLANSAFLAPYSRDQEREADRVGQYLASRAGWDPAGLTSALEALERDDKLRPGGDRKPSFFDTHPATPERVTTTEAYAKTLTAAPRNAIAGSRAAFVAHLDGLVVGAAASAGVFHEQLFLHPDMDFAIRFPDGWKTENVPSAVGGQAPDGAAALIVELDGKGDDPVAAFRSFVEKAQLSPAPTPERLTVNGLPAARLAGRFRTSRDTIVLELTWIAHGGYVFRVTGGSTPARFDAVRGALETATGSFRPLTDADRAGITEERLRVVQARAGETVAALAARTRSAWKPERIAAANDVDPGATLEAGFPVKVAMTQRYRSGAR